MHRFMVEDQVELRPDASRTRVRLDCKDLALRVIQRSNAWSSVVARTFPAAVRLSIHPQPHHSAKIGVHMLRTRDAWLTPWHGTVLDDGQRLTLVKRADAERLNATIAYRRGRPSHFVAPHLAPPFDDLDRPAILQEVSA
jgi:pyoverdine/dityrosine biosynthesis protein Dit1